MYSDRDNQGSPGWVSPFGHPRVNAQSTARRGFSQSLTSFIGVRCQGIHRWLFVAWKNKDARARYEILKERTERSGGTLMGPAYSLKTEERNSRLDASTGQRDRNLRSGRRAATKLNE